MQSPQRSGGSPAALLFLLGVMALPAAGQVRLELLEGGRVEGGLQGVEAGGALRVRTGDEVRIFKVDELISAVFRRQRNRLQGGEVALDLVSGDHVVGRIDDGRLDLVSVRSPGLGPLRLQLDHIRRLVVRNVLRDPTRVPLEAPETDEIYLAVGERLDRLLGMVLSIDRQKVVFESRAGRKETFTFEEDRIAALRLAPVDPYEEPEGVDTVARLLDGTHVSGRLVPGPAEPLRMVLGVGPEVTLERRLLQRLDFRNGRYAALSDREPVSFEETPYLEGGRRFGLLRDRGFHGAPHLRIGDQAFLRGLGLHARSRVTWDLEGRTRAFRAQVGVDPATRGGRIAGSARISVQADGETLWESGLLVAGEQPVPLVVEGLEGRRKLTVTVDYGESFQIGARGVLGDPLLIF